MGQIKAIDFFIIEAQTAHVGADKIFGWIHAGGADQRHRVIVVRVQDAKGGVDDILVQDH
ncbi:hypothetical protein ATE62_20990 [Sphingopyxis sp. HIX]|nr:hypothetical protein ATE62_20990 [Sphingopyxis sp. HIX]